MKLKWTKDGKYFAREDQVDAYDRGEKIEFSSVFGASEDLDVYFEDIGTELNE